MFCPNCQHKHQVGREKCASCGADLAPQMADLAASFSIDELIDLEIKVCPKCVKDFHASLEYCSRCGEKLIRAHLDENEEYILTE